MKGKSNKTKFHNQTIIYILFVAVGIIIGISSFATVKNFSSNNENNKASENQPSIKESPYTLEELYEIVENPEKFYELNKSTRTDYNMTVFNFYEYFSKTTPVKVASKIKIDKTGKVIEVLETKYLSYDEFKERMSDAYTSIELDKKSTEEYNKKNNDNRDYKDLIDYRYWIEILIYGNEKVIKLEQ